MSKFLSWLSQSHWPCSDAIASSCRIYFLRDFCQSWKENPCFAFSNKSWE